MVDSLGKLTNLNRLQEEEGSVFRSLAAAAAMSSDDFRDVMPLFKGITNGRGGYGMLMDFLRIATEAAEEEDQQHKACIKAVDSSVIDRKGQVGDLWQFVIEASDGRKISVSGWAY